MGGRSWTPRCPTPTSPVAVAVPVAVPVATRPMAEGVDELETALTTTVVMSTVALLTPPVGKPAPTTKSASKPGDTVCPAPYTAASIEAVLSSPSTTMPMLEPPYVVPPACSARALSPSSRNEPPVPATWGKVVRE